jgi:hypothetical protein
MSMDTIIQAEIDKVEASIQRAIERGGLPAEAEATAVYRALANTVEDLEAIVWRIEGISGSDTGEDIPEVSLDQLGVIGLLTTDVEGQLDTLQGLIERAKARMPSLSAIRAEQQHSVKRGDDA